MREVFIRKKKVKQVKTHGPHIDQKESTTEQQQQQK